MVSSLLAQGPVGRAQYRERRKALIVDGFSNHAWRGSTYVLITLLFRSGIFLGDVSTSPGEMSAVGWDTWRPAFSEYELVVLNMNNIQQPELRWPRSVEQDLEAYVAGGGGLLVFHSANNAFPHWPEYDRMIGLGWRNKDHGWAIRLNVWGEVERIPPGVGEGTSHGPRQDTLVMRLTDHPITHGAPSLWKTPDIEVYRYARGPAEQLAVLSYGRDEETGTYWPLEWVVNYGKGRVYSSSFGHLWKTDPPWPDRMRCIGFQTNLIRAAEWAATGEVNYPIPEDFPTVSSISLRSND
jgi:type 1 glutamine amidotransferase